MLTITQAARKLKLTRQRVFQLIQEKKLKAKKVGKIWIVLDIERK